jgi:alpha-mannosidase
MTLHLICQSHIDPVWLWPRRDGFAEALTTLQSAVDQMREFPEMRYTCSQAAFYRWIHDVDPRLFRQIRTLVEQGRWEVAGGWVVQADTILPSEVSLRAQGQLAQAWFREHLGVTSTIGYSVDCFGHSAALPSLLSEAGMRYYVFQRPGPADRPDLPNLFWWEAPDGARVLTWRLPHSYSQAPGTPADKLEAMLRRDWRAAIAPGMSSGAYFIGVGNHGGGPTRAHIQRLSELGQRHDADLPALRFSTLADFFADLESQPGFAAIPVLRGELLPHARGCYSANTRFKRLHRQAERDLLTAERLTSMLHGHQPTLAPAPLPRSDELSDAWWTLCFNQFHDILPGSSVPAGYEQQSEEVGAVRNAARRQALRALQTLARRADTRGAPEGTLFLTNTLPWARYATVTTDTFVSPHGDSPITHLAAPDGTRLPLQWSQADAGFGPWLKEWKKLVATVPLPAGASRWFHLAHGDAPAAEPAKAAPAQSMGDGLRLVIVDDHADTWGHYVARWDKVLGIAQAAKDKVMDDGPVFQRRRCWYTWARSTVIVDTVLWHATGVSEITLYVNWQDHFQTLKLELPLAGSSSTLTARTPGAAVTRPLDGNEWFFVDWLALGADEKRLLLVSDGVSAYDATPERLRLTVLRCVPHAQYQDQPHPEDSPDPFLDEGWQRARFWLAGAGSLSNDDMDRLATGLLTPAEYMIDNAHEPGD